MGSNFNDLLVLLMISCVPAACCQLRDKVAIPSRSEAALVCGDNCVSRENLQQAEVPAIKMFYKGDQKK